MCCVCACVRACVQFESDPKLCNLNMTQSCVAQTKICFKISKIVFVLKGALFH